MRVVVAYVFPDLDHATYLPLARRFVATYMDFPPGSEDHEVQVLVNHGRLESRRDYERLFAPLACGFKMHNNFGKDIGAYQMAAREIPCDLLVCLGAPVHFHRGGWLDRIISVYERNGPGLYGAWGFHQPADHIRTTAFWCAPELLNSYPFEVRNDSRYEFEHGRNSFHNHTRSLGLESYMVTWDGCYSTKEWIHATRSQCLLLDQHSERNHLQ